MSQHKDLSNKHPNAVHGLQVDQKRKRSSEGQRENKRHKKENSLYQIWPSIELRKDHAHQKYKPGLCVQ